MAAVKAEHEGALVAWLAAAVVRFMPFTAARLDPRAINPFKRGGAAESKKLQEVKRFNAWVALETLAREAFEAAGRNSGGGERV